ncbi:MAG: M42 family peptidase [Chloroflexi bacterium]|nr:M42 family peptidase [Chloroflexota bacterium]
MPPIGNSQIKLLEKLCNAVSVSGNESEVRKIVLEEIKPFADEVKVDALGNVLATKKGHGSKRVGVPAPVRVMLDAHMDEVGFMLVAEDGEGIYEFKTIGGIDSRSLAGKQIVVGKDHTPGVIGAKPIHLTTSSERKKSISADSLRIDLGAGGKAKPGERGTFAPNFRRVGPSLMSKALDNRLGVARLIELIKSAPSNIDLLAAFTVQEEIGLRGAKVAAQYFNPDLAIAIDATPANDLPMQYEGENTFYNTKLGLGPAIYVNNSSTIDDPRLVRFLQETAEKSKLPYQIRQPGGGGTDAGAIQKALAGIPVVSVSVPHRYTHSAMSVSRLDDWKNTLALLHAALRRITPALLKS